MKTINIFLSHRWKNTNEYEQINNWLQSNNYAIFKMYSVGKNDFEDYKIKRISERQLEDKLIERIKISSIFIALNDKSYSSSSYNWSQYELKQARKMGKKILVIKRWGMDEIPTSLTPNDGVVAWQEDSVINKIKELIY